ncbi:unnamed protein product, partial [marine sediment metagenome]
PFGELQGLIYRVLYCGEAELVSPSEHQREIVKEIKDERD